MSMFCSILFSAAVLFFLTWIIETFGLRKFVQSVNGDIYWIFSAVFLSLILSFIFLFGFFMYEEKERPMPKSAPPALISKNRKNTPEPICYFSINAKGTVESTHVGGRTEVVPVVQVKLTRYFHEENLWVLCDSENGIIQPEGRKNYFIPVLRGNLKIQFGTAQLFETASMQDNDSEWNEFRLANIIFDKENEPISLLFKHYDYEGGVWREIAGYEAFFKTVEIIEKKKPKEIPNISFEEHCKNCQQCGKPKLTEDGPQSLCEEGFRIFQREIIEKKVKKPNE
jgi:hypothetical protein